jgi:predicted RNA-binding Zn ribbon-like protein
LIRYRQSHDNGYSQVVSPSAPVTLQPGERAPAPPPLSLVQDFVNTLNREQEDEQLSSEDDLRAWLLDRHLIVADEIVTRRDLRDAHELRETLRAMLLGNNGAEVPPHVQQTFDRFADDAPLVARAEIDGSVALRPERAGVPGAWAVVLGTIARANENGTWPRLKTCPADKCEWVFYDHSRNRSGRWCTMRLCGAQAKMRRYRQRHAGARRGDHST